MSADRRMSRTFRMLMLCCSASLPLVSAELLTAQSGCQLVPQTILEPQTVTTYRWELQTEYETRPVTVAKPITVTETRERRNVVYKPVQKNRVLEEHYEVMKPITETSFREETIQETVYETSTEMRLQEFVIEKPVVETQYREEQILVRKPVNQTVLQTENVVTYRPQTVAQTVYLPTNVAVPQVVRQPLFNNRLQWLPGGYYYDPVTGVPTWQRTGLHWVPNPPVTQTVLQPGLVPTQQLETAYVPEVTQTQKPVTMTAWQDSYETRRVPLEVQRTERTVETRQVPVEVRKPVVRTRVEKVPVETVRYEKQNMVRRVPFVETVYEKVEQVEPYDVQVQKWVNETSTIQVPKQVWKRVESQSVQMVPRTVLQSVPLDAFGNLLYTVPATVVIPPTPTQVAANPTSFGGQSLPSTNSNSNVASGNLSTELRLPGRSVLQSESTTVAKPALPNTAANSGAVNPGEVVGQWQDLRRPSSLDGSALPSNAVLKKSVIVDDPAAVNVPEKSPQAGDSALEPIIKQPATPDSADRPPALEKAPVTPKDSPEPTPATPGGATPGKEDPAINGSQS
ncbi:MAG: hypothetical protein ACK56D_18125 [Planctomycetota bacterium]|jgi:hypothetical protein